MVKMNCSFPQCDQSGFIHPDCFQELEDYLNRGTSQHPETLVMFDLLWKYYEKTRNYAAAAKILAKLADRHSTEINLQQRVEYLSR